MSKFVVFYSWQSDLPANKTRSFIRECIDDAIELAQETEAIEAVRDEATTGTTGSPNIVTTLFSKINECDLFIADLSLCFSEDSEHVKKSPNPNVLIELGYAVKTLGWERVICLCNTDYGKNYPFDIAHNRITNFSLEGKSRKEVKSDISIIVFKNIRDLRLKAPRAKSGVATHLVGTYDFKEHKVINSLVPIDISKQETYVLHNKELLCESKELFAEIQELSDRMRATKAEQGETCALQIELDELPVEAQQMNTKLAQLEQAIAEYEKANEKPVVWENIDDDRRRIKHWLGIDVSDEFFDLGGLKKTALMLTANSSKYIGTDDEKAKHEKLKSLKYKLVQLDMRTNYLKTFEGMCFIPIAIQNISSIQDSDIRVLVKVEIGEIVEPSEHLIWEEYEGLQGWFCVDDEDKTDVGIVCELFGLDEDGIIHIEEEPYEPAVNIPRLPRITPFGVYEPEKTKADYRQELEEYIATSDGRRYYEFDVARLRPGECRWLCRGMLIRPDNDRIKISYQIHSSFSMGDLRGVFEIENY